MNRTIYLVFMAMVMFTGGVAVQFTAEGAPDHILGGVAILGALAVVIANVIGNGKQK